MRILYIFISGLVLNHIAALSADLERTTQQALLECSQRNIFEPDQKCLRKRLMPLIPLSNIEGCSADLLNGPSAWPEKNACLRTVVKMSCGRKSARLLNGCGATTVPQYEHICLEALLETTCGNPLGYVRKKEVHAQ